MLILVKGDEDGKESKKGRKKGSNKKKPVWPPDEQAVRLH